MLADYIYLGHGSEYLINLSSTDYNVSVFRRWSDTFREEGTGQLASVLAVDRWFLGTLLTRRYWQRTFSEDNRGLLWHFL